MTKALAKKEEAGALSTSVNYGESAGIGFEGQTADDLMVPFITVLQGLSPQVQAEDSDCKIGQLFNTVTEQAVDGKTGIGFIPLVVQHLFIEWIPRKQGGGFVSAHEITSPIVAEAREKSTKFGKFNTEYDDKGEPVGNELVETYYVYAMTTDGESPGSLVLIAFTGTKIRVFKRWNTRIRGFSVLVDGERLKPPLFAHRTRLTSTKEKNTEGEFANFVLSPEEGDLESSRIPADSPLLQEAVALREQVLTGKTRAAYESTQDDGSGEGAGGQKAPF